GGAAEAEEEEEYEVEAVLAQRARCGSMEYQVKWKGYTYMESTWLPAANLSGCPELIVEFESGM
ncbi:chromo domain-like protein, partial [Pavlovales sp. CCMP2436]